jgi:hypothetical protein
MSCIVTAASSRRRDNPPIKNGKIQCFAIDAFPQRPSKRMHALDAPCRAARANILVKLERENLTGSLRTEWRAP